MSHGITPGSKVTLGFDPDGPSMEVVAVVRESRQSESLHLVVHEDVAVVKIGGAAARLRVPCRDLVSHEEVWQPSWYGRDAA